MNVSIRRVQPGDEAALALIQTENWKAAFASILDGETLARCTNLDRATAMYAGLIAEKKGNGYLLSVDGQPHCIAWWDAARDEAFAGKAELICIHSLPGNWRRGFGGLMMDRVLADIGEAGFPAVVLWIFTDNARARAFYAAKGFHATEDEKPGFAATEICYETAL